MNHIVKLSELYYKEVQKLLKKASVDTKTFPHGFGGATSPKDLGDKATQDRLLAWSETNSSFASIPDMASWAPGDVDGIWGKRSKAMLKNFMNSMNLPDSTTESQARAKLAQDFPTGTNSDKTVQDPWAAKPAKPAGSAPAKPNEEQLTEKQLTEKQLGDKELNAGNYQKAIAHYTAAYGGGNDPAALYNLAFAYRYNDDISSSDFYFNKYIQHNPYEKDRVEYNIKRFDSLHGHVLSPVSSSFTDKTIKLGKIFGRKYNV